MQNEDGEWGRYTVKFEMAWQLCTYFKNVPFHCSHKIKAKLQKSLVELASRPNGEHVSHSSCIWYYSVLCSCCCCCCCHSHFTLGYPVGASFMVNWHSKSKTDTHILCATRLLTCQLKRLSFYLLWHILYRDISPELKSQAGGNRPADLSHTSNCFPICFRAVICGYLRALC